VVTEAALRHFVRGNGGGDPAVAWVADRQLALITTVQLAIVGIGRGAVASRRDRKSLHQVFRGVFLVGHDIPPPGAIELAAVLAVHPPAFVSHRSALSLWGLVKDPPGEVEVTVPGRNCRSRPGLVVHKARVLDWRDHTTRFGIPVTSPARTLIDYAATAGADALEWAIAEACGAHLTDEQRILAAVERVPNHPGVGRIRTILGQPGGPARTRSGGERAMLRLIRAARLPPPRVNYPVAGFTADFCWPDQRLIVEVDGYDFHSNRAAFERDHRRDLVHKEAGYEVLRFTGRQLDEEPLVVLAAIVRALGRRAHG
jgi:very-short-patch-repair endonuclease/predicted transcriptional regulator of viral defense system